MRAYEFFENYYRCVYAVSEIYEYSVKFMDVQPRKDDMLKEAQSLVLFSLHYILNIDRKYIIKYLNTNYETLERMINFASAKRDKQFKQNILLIYKEFKNEHRRVYKKY